MEVACKFELITELLFLEKFEVEFPHIDRIPFTIVGSPQIS